MALDRKKPILTGVTNFEKLIGGSFWQGDFILILGDHGTGKTTFALQYLVKGIAEHGDKGFFVTFLDEKDEILEDANHFGWSAKDMERKGSLEIIGGLLSTISHSKKKTKNLGTKLINTIIEACEDFGGDRFVLDGLDELRELFDDELSFRSGLSKLKRELKQLGYTSIVTCSGDVDVEGLVDAVIVLHYESAGLDKTRALEIRKMRKSDHTDRMIPFEITNNGFNVAQLPDEEEKFEREASGIYGDGEYLGSLIRGELRNRIQIAQGYLEFLYDSNLTDEQIEWVQKGYKNILKADEIAKKLGTFLKLKETETEEVNLNPMIIEAINENRELSAEDGIKIDYDESDFLVKGSPLLREIFSNLIHCSINYSQANEIKITCQETDGKVHVSLENDGRGIPNEAKENTFRDGFKADGQMEIKMRLYLAKQIAEHHGGSVEINDSELGGERFDIYLEKA